jgi:hypothetical protein
MQQHAVEALDDLFSDRHGRELDGQLGGQVDINRP